MTSTSSDNQGKYVRAIILSLSNTVRHTEVFTRATPTLNPWALKDFQAFRNRAEFYILEGQMSFACTWRNTNTDSGSSNIVFKFAFLLSSDLTGCQYCVCMYVGYLWWCFVCVRSLCLLKMWNLMSVGNSLLTCDAEAWQEKVYDRHRGNEVNSTTNTEWLQRNISNDDIIRICLISRLTLDPSGEIQYCHPNRNW